MQTLTGGLDLYLHDFTHCDAAAAWTADKYLNMEAYMKPNVQNQLGTI